MAAAAARQDRGAIEAALRMQADELVAEGVPAVVVLVRNGQDTIRIADGVVDRRTDARLRASDRFRLGSVTKSYVATVVLQLVAEHRLGLDDTVERWLPGLIPNGDQVSVRELLGHTSGLYDYWGDRNFFVPYRAGDFAYHYTPLDLVRISTSHPPRFPPGTRFSYTNTGYIVLGLIVEAVTGEPLATVLDKRIFEPLHLEHTSFGRGTTANSRDAHGYMQVGGQSRDVAALDMSFDWAAGAIVANADDIARFYRALLTGRLLAPAYARLMTTVLFPGSGYGFGIMRRRLVCGTTYGHAGDTPGFTADVHSSLDGRRQAVALMSGNLPDLARPVRQAFFRLSADAYCDSAELARQTRTNHALPEVPQAPRRHALP